MKKCPNCNAEWEDNFEVCWSCSYNKNGGKVVEVNDVDQGGRNIDCLRCRVPLVFSGNYKFHEGTNLGFFGNLFEVFVNKKSFDIYVCPECGKVEFYVPGL